MSTFAHLLTTTCYAQRLTTRELSTRTGLDASAVSKLRRARLVPPQDAETLDRISAAFGWPIGSPAHAALCDAARADAAMVIPPLTDEEVAALMPGPLFWAHRGAPPTQDDLDRIAEMIRAS